MAKVQRVKARTRVASKTRRSALDARLEAVRTNGYFMPEIVATFRAFLEGAEDLDLFRMSPVRYALATGTDEATAINLFLHATHAGILEFNWGVVCPQCGSFINTASGLRSLTLARRCSLCTIAVRGSIDNNVEIAFTVSPTVRPIKYHHPETLDFFSEGLNCMFSRSVEFEPAFLAFIRDAIRGSYVVPANGRLVIKHDMNEKRYVLIEPADHLAAYVAPSKGAPKEITLELLNGQLVPDDAKIAPGPARITIRNRTSKPAKIGWMADVGVLPGGHRFFEGTRGPMKFLPFLTGKRMLTSQTFRDLFRTESLPAENGLEFKSLTLLFTDLKGSTEMYRRMGDFKAYALVREHFALLKKLVNASGGAVVKTIGDAIMASFADPADALEAAIDMHKEISSVGMDQDLMLKIGIHTGPCIAVELNERLDYFGQTVNIAARVQGVAEAGEIVTSDSVLESPEVRAVIKKAKLADSREEAALKGVSDNFSVHRLRPAKRSSRLASTTRE